MFDPIKDAYNFYLLNENKKKSITPLYQVSNERLDLIFNEIDFVGKDVLSVMASGDQPILCYLYGANVDTFDRNIYAYYMYYLRKWLILYTDYNYFDNNLFFDQYKYILEYIMKRNIINDLNDEITYIFWKEFFKLNNYSINIRLFEIYCNKYFDYLKKYKYRLIDEKNCINFNFKNYDIYEDIKCNKKYDIIILSNILEYKNDYNYLNKARINIEKLLKDNGFALCSYLKNVNRNNQKHLNEVEIMCQNNLCVEDLGLYNPSNDYFELAYKYKKTS